MSEFIVIDIIAKNMTLTNEYLICILDMVDFTTCICTYDDRSDEIFELDLNPTQILNSFVEYKSGNKFKPHILYKIIKSKHILLYENTKIYHFDRTRTSIRSINYSLKRDKKIFIPCFFNHLDNDNIETKWGKYVKDYSIGDNIKIPGYIVTSKKDFDNYILNIETFSYNYKIEDYKSVILNEFKDYLYSLDNDLGDLIYKSKSGKEISIQLD